MGTFLFSNTKYISVFYYESFVVNLFSLDTSYIQIYPRNLASSIKSTYKRTSLVGFIHFLTWFFLFRYTLYSIYFSFLFYIFERDQNTLIGSYWILFWCWEFYFYSCAYCLRTLKCTTKILVRTTIIKFYKDLVIIK